VAIFDKAFYLGNAAMPFRRAKRRAHWCRGEEEAEDEEEEEEVVLGAMWCSGCSPWAACYTNTPVASLAVFVHLDCN